jgi:hypothetical protein
VSPRPSGRRFAAFLAGLAVAASAFGGLVLPRFADAELPASMKVKPSLVKQKLEDGRCHNRHVEETDLGGLDGMALVAGS